MRCQLEGASGLHTGWDRHNRKDMYRGAACTSRMLLVCVRWSCAVGQPSKQTNTSERVTGSHHTASAAQGYVAILNDALSHGVLLLLRYWEPAHTTPHRRCGLVWGRTWPRRPLLLACASQP